MSPKTNKRPNDIQPKVGDKVRFIPVANCTCVHCGVNMSGFRTVFVVMAVRGQKLLLAREDAGRRCLHGKRFM